MVSGEFMLILVIAFIIFAAYRVYKSIKEEQEKLEQEKYDRTIKIRGQLKNLAELCGINNMLISTENLEKEIIGILKTRYRTQIDGFLMGHKMLTPLIDTHSALSVCAVSSDTLYYMIDKDLGVNDHNGLLNSSISINYASSEQIQNYKEILRQNIKFDRYTLPISDIVMFKIEGNKQFVTETSGGGANIEGAVVGGLLFGGAGAIVGGQVGTEIKSTTKEMDNRIISLYYYSDGKLMVENIRSTNIDATISALRQIIPQKEESVVQLETNKEKRSRITESTKSNISIVDELKNFKELLDSDIITQEEFEAKRKQLLGL